MFLNQEEYNLVELLPELVRNKDVGVGELPYGHK